MATLAAPGVEVSVINESFYVPADAGTTPLFIVASGQDKKNGAGTGTASGTTTATANTAYLLSSQRELTETFGDPKFYTDAAGNPLNGYELNEYGLQAAYSFLGIANKAYVLRANVNLTELYGSATAPSAAASDGTYWHDLASSLYGIFEWSATNQALSAKTPTLITDKTNLVGGATTGAPKTSVGSQGDYVVNTTHVTNKIFYKNDSNAWVQLGSTAWHESHPTIEGTTTSGTLVSGNAIVINGVTVTLDGTTFAKLAETINTHTVDSTGIPGVTAAVDSVTGKFQLFVDGVQARSSGTIDNKITIANSSGTI